MNAPPTIVRVPQSREQGLMASPGHTLSLSQLYHSPDFLQAQSANDSLVSGGTVLYIFTKAAFGRNQRG